MQIFSGASVRRVIDRSRTQVPEHAHDWPVLSLFVMGSYLNETEIGGKFICSPSAVFYRAGAAHRNTVAEVGFEQIEIEFDPAWLGTGFLPNVPVARWIGGELGVQARRLAHICEGNPSESHLRAVLRGYLQCANVQPKLVSATWVDTLRRRLQEDTSLKVADLARELGRHPSWTGSVYRHATGEGLQQTAARLRVEHATRLLRETNQACASIALDTGFCDQSHMNRTFRRVLGRLPTVVRQDRLAFRRPSVQLDSGHSQAAF